MIWNGEQARIKAFLNQNFVEKLFHKNKKTQTKQNTWAQNSVI